MRYDKVAEFFYCCTKELLRQANADMKRGRKQLAVELTSVWGISNILQQQLKKVFALCKPHMKEELGSES